MSSNSKRIAKNTLFLYLRMMFLMIITFYTSRVVLDKLGVEDYGIQNVVGGLASMFVFFRSSLSNATQRFISIALGKNEVDETIKIFSQHQTLYIAITVLVVVFAETVGLYFLYHKLVIPENRFNAAFWVFQFTVIALVFTILTTVYDSILIAHEEMKVYSYIGIAEGIAKLGIAFILSIVSFDKLITYSCLLTLVSIGTFACYYFYCNRKYEEAHYKFIWDRKSVKETFSFISWNVVGTAVWAINDQGINVLLNMFFGPAVNAARGLAFQVSQGVNHFSANFYTAIRPQITKSYASGEYNYLFKLIFCSSKYSIYLLWYLSLPLIMCIDYVLQLWLKEVPEYTNMFCVWVLLYSLVNSLTNPIWTLALAIGKLKKYILIGSGVFLMTFPIAYLALRYGCSPISVFIIAFFVRVCYIIVVLSIVRCYITFSLKVYSLKVILPSALVVVPSGLLGYIIKPYIDNSIYGLIIAGICSTLVISVLIWICGIDKNEREYVKSFIRSKIKAR